LQREFKIIPPFKTSFLKYLASSTKISRTNQHPHATIAMTLHDQSMRTSNKSIKDILSCTIVEFADVQTPFFIFAHLECLPQDADHLLPA
jgi:hypothetical protein